MLRRLSPSRRLKRCTSLLQSVPSPKQRCKRRPLRPLLLPQRQQQQRAQQLAAARLAQWRECCLCYGLHGPSSWWAHRASMPSRVFTCPHFFSSHSNPLVPSDTQALRKLVPTHVACPPRPYTGRPPFDTATCHTPLLTVLAQKQAWSILQPGCQLHTCASCQQGSRGLSPPRSFGQP